MIDPQRVVIVHTPEIAERGAELFDGAPTLYANGELPDDALQYAAPVVVGPDDAWRANLCWQFVAAGIEPRAWPVDVSNCTLRREIVELSNIKGGPVPFTNSAPQVAQAARPATLPEVPPPFPPAEDCRPADAEPLPNPAPPPTDGNLPAPADLRAVGDGPSQEPPERAQDNAPPGWHTEIDDTLETQQKAIRQASARKRIEKDAREEFNAEEWPNPADFWGVTVMPPIRPEYLPPQIADYIFDQSERAGIDPAQVALNCYVACAALIRSGIELQMQEGDGDGRVWKEKPILWGAVVADPSSGKGPALDIALHKFFKIASTLRAKDEAAWEQYDIDLKIYEKRMQAYITEAAKNADAEKPEAPKKPPRERLWTDDVTKEVVAKLLTENPRGKIAIIKDELASWFGGFDAYGNGKSDKDRPDWLSFYESKERYIDRAMEGRSYHVESWGGIILGGIQPEVIAKISGKLGADGMLQRFQIIVSGPKGKGQKRPPNSEALRQWNRIQENLAGMQSHGVVCRLSPEAAEFMEAKEEWITDAMQAGLAPALVASLGKWPGLFGRLMIVSHCIECAALGMQSPDRVVPLRIAEQAWKWLRWVLWPHAVHFYSGLADQGEEYKSVRAFAEYVLARDITTVRPYRLAQSWSHYGRNFKTIAARREFWARVEQSGWIRSTGEIDRSTNIAREYAVNPRAFDGRFADQVEKARLEVERHRRAMHPDMLAQQARQPGQD